VNYFRKQRFTAVDRGCSNEQQRQTIFLIQ